MPLALSAALATLDLSALPGWVVPAMGLAAAGLTFAIGFSGLGRRHGRTEAPPPAPEAPPDRASDPFLEGSRSERRSAFRRQGNAVEVVVAERHDTAQAVPGWVVDRSVRGLGLRLEAAAPVGALLCVRPRDASPLIPWTDIEVRSCRPGRDGWEVGCQFVRTPPWGVLLLFG